MKRIPLPLALIIGLLCRPASATAQVPLLEIDYQNATVFHVLDDGRLLLPLGAADGYVLTTDDEGFATWQAATSTGGLHVVTSNTTLTGEGTAASPLGVSVPLFLTSGNNYGAVQAFNTNGNEGSLGSDFSGVVGEHNNRNSGALGNYETGVWAFHHEGNIGYLADADYGAYGRYRGSGPSGFLGSVNYGAYGMHGQNGPAGYLGGTNYGAHGIHNSGNAGFLGGSTFAVWGLHTNGNIGYLGHTNHGAFGQHTNGNYGSLGGYFYGVRGQNANDNRAYLGHDDFGLWATGSPWAGYFEGNVQVTGTLTGGSATSKVDHPLDPAGKYLSHSFVESSEMKTVYDGTVVLDAEGEATVVLPDYIEALNGDFRYQLTAIGAPGPNLYVAEEISGNRFKIAGGAPGMKVSWQVTGIRQDAWAEQNRIVVEEAKSAEERGYYLHPALYGQPEERSVAWARDPEGMRALQAMPAQIEEERRKMQEELQRMQAEHERLQTERAQRPTPRANRP